MTRQTAATTDPEEARRAFLEPTLRARGFEGFGIVRVLRETRLAAVPKGPGVYVVLRPPEAEPVFLRKSLGGHFKGNDPTVPVATLKAKWIAGAHVIYIGKATPGPTGTSGLRKRLGQLLQYGAGKPVGHQGGRYLWQVKESDDYLVAWRLAPDPTASENRLLDEFTTAYGSLPFANIAGPRG